jgi:MFS family permease
VATPPRPRAQDGTRSEQQESSMTNALTESAPGALVGEARVNPRTGRPAGLREIAFLVAASCLSVLGAVLLAPLLPQMAREFASTPGSSALVPLVLTIPALFIALLSPFAGRIVDKLGRKRVLVIALFLYAVLGTAPLWVVPLGGILITRIGLGITEAFIMTCCTTLIADYFVGSKRERYLGLQALVTAVAATVFLAIGGAIGSSGWRAPFWLYAVSIVLAIGMIVVIWPTRQDSDGNERAAEKLPPMNWRALAAPVIVSVFGGLVFYTLVVELSFVLTERGVTATASIGLFSALASLATAAGALGFRWLIRLGVRTLLAGAFGLAGVGMIVIMTASSVTVVMVGAVITSFGAGVLLPTLINWAINGLEYDQRGRGTGAWTAALFFGEFLCPLIIVGLGAAAGGLTTAIGIVGIASLVVAVLLGITLRTPRPAAVPA